MKTITLYYDGHNLTGASKRVSFEVERIIRVEGTAPEVKYLDVTIDNAYCCITPLGGEAILFMLSTLDELQAAYGLITNLSVVTKSVVRLSGIGWEVFIAAHTEGRADPHLNNADEALVTFPGGMSVLIASTLLGTPSL